MKRKRVRAAPNGSRAKILRAAEELFVRRGYRQTSLDDILRASRVSRSNLYYHFRSKREVLHQVLGTWLNASQEMFLPGLANGSLSAPAKVRGLLELEAKWIAGVGRGVGCPLLNLAMDLARSGGLRGSELSRYQAAFTKALESLIREGAQRGQLRKGIDPRSTACLVLAAIQGVAVLAQLNKSTRTTKDCARQLSQLLEPN